MNRNVESHFARLPSVDIQRAKFDRSRGIKTSFNAGELIPFMVEEILPGDTFDITTAKVIRSQTMLTPVMDSMFLDTFYFFVPNRLVYDHWEEFCGENKNGAWAPTRTYQMPSITTPEGGFASGTIADYMGLPVGVEWKASDELSPTSLPFRAYALICNEFFRDENLSDPLLIPTGEEDQQGSNGSNYITDVANGGKPFKVAKTHSYFTSALPQPQKGSAVGIPIDVPLFSGGVFPVTTTGNVSANFGGYPLVLSRLNDQNFTDVMNPPNISGGEANYAFVKDNTVRLDPDITDGIGGRAVAPLNLAVTIPDQNDGQSSASASFDVNELRLAFAYQRYLEALARSGSRYTEILLGLFNVKSPDARLQRPEYLGGNRVPLNVSEVTNNAQTSTDYLGDLGAKSQTNDVHRDVQKSFVEHGYLIGLMCVRYDHSYSQGIDRFWTRKTFTDFYNPKFANLGETPIYQAEIYATPENINDKSKVFGYQEIWADYRYGKNLLTGEMRPGVQNSLAHWNLGDYYDSVPYLSDEWIRETPANVDRVLAVSSSVANQFWADIFVRNIATRPMPLYSVPGLIDHF